MAKKKKPSFSFLQQVEASGKVKGLRMNLLRTISYGDFTFEDLCIDYDYSSKTIKKALRDLKSWGLIIELYEGIPFSGDKPVIIYNLAKTFNPDLIVKKSHKKKTPKVAFENPVDPASPIDFQVAETPAVGSSASPKEIEWVTTNAYESRGVSFEDYKAEQYRLAAEWQIAAIKSSLQEHKKPELFAFGEDGKLCSTYEAEPEPIEEDANQNHIDQLQLDAGLYFNNVLEEQQVIKLEQTLNYLQNRPWYWWSFASQKTKDLNSVLVENLKSVLKELRG